MPQRDLIVSFLSSVPSSVRPMFASAPLLLQSPVSQAGGGGYPGGRPGYQQWIAKYADADGNVIPGMFAAAGGGPGDTIGRVCVMGFSNGCIGVDEVLRMNDSAKLDLVLAVDGIHGGYLPDGQTLRASSYKRLLNHAAHVALQPDAPGSPCMVVTHSAIVPPGYPSTTETADFIWEKTVELAAGKAPMLNCGYDCGPARHVSELGAVHYPGGEKLCSTVGSGCYTWSGFADGWYDRRAVGGTFVFGWGDAKDGQIRTRDPSGNADHIYQGRIVLRELLKRFAVGRYNSDCGMVATAALASGLPAAAMTCALGDGVIYDESDAVKTDFFPEIGPGTGAPPLPCPPPPDGMVIAGKPGDPCHAVPAGNTTPPALPPAAGPPAVTVPWGRVLGFSVGAAVGFGAARMLTKAR